jgi:transcriptional regulator with XRE-family HTH domain
MAKSKNQLVDVVRAAVQREKDGGVSQAAIARKAKVSPAKLSDYINGNKDIKTATLARLAKVLGLAFK